MKGRLLLDLEPIAHFNKSSKGKETSVKSDSIDLIHRKALALEIATLTKFLVIIQGVRSKGSISERLQRSDRGDVPGWVLVVLMTTGLITGIWTVAAPRISSILTHSLDSMSNIR
jgi:uncharacterized membrane protein YqjE